MLKKIISIILIALSGGCTNYIHNKEIYENRLIIDSININNKINISSINNDIYGIVLFSEYGRPNIEKTNTIIGAHSGYGPNAYFNLLSSIEIGSYIELLYEGNTYIYEIINVYETLQTDITVLDNYNYTSLTLMTCKEGDINMRIIVISKLI